MNFDKVRSILEKKLNEKLPGHEAHLLMAPKPVDMRRFSSSPKEGSRSSSVLILMYPDQNRTFFPLIKRPKYPGVHSGQVAFPGGKMEESDRDIFHTALREAEEEIGVSQKEIQIIGSLTSLYIPASNFLVHPVIGFTTNPPNWIPDQKEVERVIATDIHQLIQPETKRETILEPVINLKLQTPYFDIQGEIVWGATAMILSELIEIIQS